MKPPSRDRAATLLALASILLAIVASAWLATWSCSYQGVSDEITFAGIPPRVVETQTEFCGSLIAENGRWVLILLAIPIVIAGIGLAAGRRGPRRLVLAMGILLLLLCAIGAFSIGMWFFPAAIALLISGLLRANGSDVRVEPVGSNSLSAG